MFKTLVRAVFRTAAIALVFYVIYQYSVSFAYWALGVFILLIAFLSLVTERGRNAYKRVFLWRRLFRIYGCADVCIEKWCKGNGDINGYGYYFDSGADQSGVFIRNRERGAEFIFVPWDVVSLVERFPHPQADNKFFVRLTLWGKEKLIIGIPWDLSFEGCIPDSVGYQRK